MGRVLQCHHVQVAQWRLRLLEQRPHSSALLFAAQSVGLRLGGLCITDTAHARSRRAGITAYQHANLANASADDCARAPPQRNLDAHVNGNAHHHRHRNTNIEPHPIANANPHGDTRATCPRLRFQR